MTPPLNTFIIKRTFTTLLDAILPPRCPATGALVGVQGTLSPEYWAQLHFIRKPFCACCGNPFQIAPHDSAPGNPALDDLRADMLCGRCMTVPPSYHSARAALAYDDASSGLLLKFKHGDKTLLANSFADWMLQADASVLDECDYLIPVPLHRWRLLKRRYNQAALLAYALGARVKKPVLPMALKRVRHTASQGHKSGPERAENINGAFAIADHDKKRLQGKHLVLIDDVMTSGATVDECTKTLLNAGAKRVDVLTLARVVYNA